MSDASEKQTDAPRKRRPWWVLTSYFAEGFPFYMLRSVVPLYLKKAGHSNTLTGLVQVLFVPWTLKFLWAPLVDLYSTKRRWIIGAEFLISIILFLIAGWMAFNTEVELEGGWLWSFVALVLVGSTLAATQDIAVDAAYIENLSPKEQQAWTGTRVAAFRVAKVLGSGLMVVIAGLISWPFALLCASVLFFCTALLHLKVLPRTAARSAAGRRSPLQEFIEAARTFARRDGALWILLFAFFFKIGDAMLFSMGPNFLADLKVKTVVLGVFGSTDILCSIAGALFGGWLISRFSLRRSLLPLALLFNAADLLYAWYASLGVDPDTAQTTALFVTGFEQFVGGLGTAAYMVAFMLFSRGAHTASHYAVLTAVMGLETLVAAPLAGVLADSLGWELFFVVCFLMGLPGMALAGKLVPYVGRLEDEQTRAEEREAAL